MDSSEEEALFIIRGSTNTDISAEITGKRVQRLAISGSASILYLPLKADCNPYYQSP